MTEAISALRLPRSLACPELFGSAQNKLRRRARKDE